ncbi:MAG: hypothetical protein LBB53_04310 [Prevotellaceae bacterium]|jgi:hypothetical protein|nr:hypothetical protein [Prevotellaceae bacterium]
MKKIFFLISIVLLFSNCDRNVYKTYNWGKFPIEQFESYFPCSEGETIKFASENFDTIAIDIDAFNIFNTAFQVCKEEYKAQSFGENVNYQILDLVNNNSAYRFSLLGHVINRHYISFSAEIYCGLNVEVSFNKYLPFDENYMPYDENEIFTYLTDTITLRNTTKGNIAFLVSGKGLVSFTDNDGMKWTQIN